ncbi:hypothetical protein C2845_PM09G09970 [Panicum miliaceum]|uniref:Uncharacterized protein n=1 Tax=Panicum miliaceum TaxID=4540 RepID=A0A3L6S180_PANMI|nr:hypothetical protein C2845_PM09G09970 [Panicum miliaceum]
MTRKSVRQLARGTLHIDEPAAEIQEDNNGSGSDTSSDDGEESDENYKMSPRGIKRSGRFMRGNSSSGGPGAGSGIGGGNNDDQQGDDEKDEEQSCQPVFVTGVVMRRPSVPHDYVNTDYMKRGMTAKVRTEREKNQLNMRKGRSIEYRFQTKFHQDFYESAILSKKYKKDYHPEPTLAQVIQARQQDAAQGDDDEAAPDAAPHFPSA